MTVRPAPRLKLLIDTNVLLDVVLVRKPWVEDATALLDAVAKHRAEGYVAGHVITTLYYVVEHERNRALAATALSDLLQLLTVAPLGNADFQRALGLGLRDFEYSTQAAACLQVGGRLLGHTEREGLQGRPCDPALRRRDRGAAWCRPDGLIAPDARASTRREPVGYKRPDSAWGIRSLAAPR